jgi:uncharacterized protein YndB with AHSA1/START domain
MKSKIEIETFYPHAPDRVWRALTDPAALADWLMENDFVPKLGHKFQFRAKPQPGWRGIVDCEVVALDEPKRLAYTWQGEVDGPKTMVTWTLEAAPGGTKVKLVHDGFTGLGGLFHKLVLGSGWKKMLRTKALVVLSRMTEAGEYRLPPNER